MNNKDMMLPFINMSEEEQLKKIREDINMLKRECLLANVPLFVTIILNYAYANKDIPFDRVSEGVHPAILAKQPEDVEDNVISNCMKLLNGWGVTDDPSIQTDESLKTLFDEQMASQQSLNKTSEELIDTPPI